MQDGTYPTRDFATLGPLWLQPPLVVGLYSMQNIETSLQNTWQISDPILHFKIQQSPVFLVNSRSPLLLDAHIELFNKFNGFSSPEVTKQFCRVPLILLFPRFSIFYQLTFFGFSTVYKLSRQNIQPRLKCYINARYMFLLYSSA